MKWAKFLINGGQQHLASSRNGDMWMVGSRWRYVDCYNLEGDVSLTNLEHNSLQVRDDKKIDLNKLWDVGIWKMDGDMNMKGWMEVKKRDVTKICIRFGAPWTKHLSSFIHINVRNTEKNAKQDRLNNRQSGEEMWKV